MQRALVHGGQQLRLLSRVPFAQPLVDTLAGIARDEAARMDCLEALCSARDSRDNAADAIAPSSSQAAGELAPGKSKRVRRAVDETQSSSIDDTAGDYTV